MTTANGTTTLDDLLRRHELENFVYAEARALDDRDYRAWLGFFGKDIRYWAPTRLNRWPREAHLEIAGADGAAIFDEDSASLNVRVRRLETDRAWVEYPASRSRRFITNVQVDGTDDPDVWRVRCNFLVYVSRRERDEQYFFGTRDDLIRRDSGDHGWAICSRTVTFDHTTILADGISVLF
ncbi:aromatic-ring-hydroxylating dioxygenase subunit beta [Dactylosporangium roseum]|uniref:Aromatic-ring-hydroxylating dioxygenase subunit beta n=1 Tax=Dactylosporangium roseum TaxID=47989 RepID=A0ABY5ZC86_9ACTN|nr:aromatic-ring-hydroxylating dioxygenase subunit beta [Dactylosporangium roseum]UWZ39710.1 aromatic-ring-hydroxylating dioxygenase subunit beta [Dactylosporangium roseum]